MLRFLLEKLQSELPREILRVPDSIPLHDLLSLQCPLDLVVLVLVDRAGRKALLFGSGRPNRACDLLGLLLLLNLWPALIGEIKHVDGYVLPRLEILPEVNRAMDARVFVRILLKPFRSNQVVLTLLLLSLVVSYPFLRPVSFEIGCILGQLFALHQEALLILAFQTERVAMKAIVILELLEVLHVFDL